MMRFIFALLLSLAATEKLTADTGAINEFEKSYLAAQHRSCGFCRPIDRFILRSLAETLNGYYDGQYAKAKRYFSAGSYLEAEELYEEILSAVDRGCYPKIKQKESLILKVISSKLAECRLLLASHEMNIEEPLLMHYQARATLFKNELEKSIMHFTTSVLAEKPEEQACFAELCFERGFCLLQQNHFEEAAQAFQRAICYKNHFGYLSSLYLARLFIEENKYGKVDPLLAELEKAPNINFSLLCESFYLRGIASFLSEDYEKAKKFLAKSLEEKGVGCWRTTHYYLGWCNIKLAEPLPLEQKIPLWDSAERHFLMLQDDSQALLALQEIDRQRALLLR